MLVITEYNVKQIAVIINYKGIDISMASDSMAMDFGWVFVTYSLDTVRKVLRYGR